MKRILTALLSAALCVPSSAGAADDIRVIADGGELSFEAAPRIVEGRTLVPMRAVFEALGADVFWDGISRAATGTKGSAAVTVMIDSPELIKNGERITLDVSTALIDGYTFVPLRAVAEAFGCEVSWDGAARIVSIETEPSQVSKIPPYSGEPYAALNGNEPYFEPEELTEEPFEIYSELDALGRCGEAYANICRELMPAEERGSIGSVKPAGWHTVKYDFIEGKYLYNRCHLIGFQLAGENANKRNLITGTRYLNAAGMLPFENLVADYVKETDNHVLYRVTPIYDGDNLIANGVRIEARSVEDDGIRFNVFCYNVQPGVIIDYRTGESRAE